MDPIDFELSRPFKFAGKDGETECGFIRLEEPSGKVSHICSSIEGLLKTAMMGMAGRFTEGGDLAELADSASTEPKAEDEATESLLQQQLAKGDGTLMLMSGSGVDMGKITLHFRDLFKQVAYMGGEKLITVPRLDEMSHKDMRRMIGVYTANFITD